MPFREHYLSQNCEPRMNSAAHERAKVGSPGSRPERGESGVSSVIVEPNESCAPSSPDGSNRSRAAAGGVLPISETPVAKGRIEVVERTHALIAWILPVVAHFPKHHRYSLGTRIETQVYAVLEQLVRAAYADRVYKVSLLDDANITLEVLRHNFRIAFSLKLVSIGQVEHATRLLDEVGKQVGGWRRNLL